MLMIQSCTAVLKLQIEPLQYFQQAFDKLQDFLFSLKFVLNANKTKFMIFSGTRDIADICLHVTSLRGHSFERGAEYKYLGICLEKKLTFKFHINTTVHSY